jgi:MFS family permease
MRPPLPRSVKLLGWTSLFTDAATEAIYPLIPVFVTRVLGGSAISLGVIEGAADAISSTLKLVAGRLSDRTGRRKPFVVAGYTLAWLARPLVALAATWQHVFFVRLVDRIGKGLRGAPRDAMLGALAPADQRGRVFGFHRAMDHAGAVVGPLAAAAFLWFFPGQYRALFALTFIPGALAVAMLLFVPEVRMAGSRSSGKSGGGLRRFELDASAESAAIAHSTHQTEPTHPTDQPEPTVPGPLKRFLIILAIFTLGNSSDAFLLLRLSDAGLATVYLPIVWAGLHVIKSGLSTLFGTLSDRWGRVRLIAGGWIVYAVIYTGFAVSESLAPLLAWFLAYGLYFALVEGSEKALVADLTPRELQGTAFGYYNAVLGFGALVASLTFGALWEIFGATAAFLTAAALAITAASLLVADRSLASPS